MSNTIPTNYRTYDIGFCSVLLALHYDVRAERKCGQQVEFVVIGDNISEMEQHYFARKILIDALTLLECRKQLINKINIALK